MDSEWTDDEVNLLTDFYEQKPHLWDTSTVDYRGKVKKKAAEAIIAATFQKSSGH